MNFLNSGAGYALFKKEARKKTYMDKSLLVDEVYRYSQDVNGYICVTRPRRFGKSTAANMIAAFFDECTAQESRKLFEGLELGKCREEQEAEWQEDPELAVCWPHQGKHKVLRINMIDLMTERIHSYQDFFEAFNRRMLEDIAEAYPALIYHADASIPEILEKTGDNFIFVIDEWDAVFEMRFMTENDKKAYIDFLKALLKDKKYVHFAYMTGILPIAKYSSGSPLNMFHEFTSFQDAMFYPYFGLTRDEIEKKMEEKGFCSPSMEELSFWYDGYVRGYDGMHVYNPASVSKALAEGCCQNNWTGTGPMNEVQDLIRYNVQDVREDVIRMAGGEILNLRLSGFTAEKTQISTKDEIFSAMVVYGFLTYHKEQLGIPNHELLMKFQEALTSVSLGLKQTIEESRRLLNATLEMKDEEIASMIEDLHDDKIPFFKYNDENSLACVVTIAYLAALDQYRITREDKAGKGYVDFLFDPLDRSDIPIILELKYNHSAENALKCIRERGYEKRFRDYRRVLLVGINYSEATKKHTCITELVK